MGIMPHTDIDRALQLALSLDIPFWPQLPRVSFYEDMYVQASQFLPGISLDLTQQRVVFNTAEFENNIGEYEKLIGEPEGLALTREYSTVYHRFLEKDLSGYYAVRGQMTGPVSFGFRIVDEENKPIIYNESVKTILFDFMQRKANTQWRQLCKKNPRAFVWLDEPGLGWVFSGFTGYNDVQATQDYRNFCQGLEGLKALHLCATVNLPYLLGLGIEVLSFDAYALEFMPMGYTEAIGNYLREGNIICWGIVPTDSTNLGKETPDSLAAKLVDYWEKVTKGTGVEGRQIAEQAMIAPARCCLKNIGSVGGVDDNKSSGAAKPAVGSIEEQLVEKAFSYLPVISAILKDKYRLD
jgi:hypothetical protein